MSDPLARRIWCAVLLALIGMLGAQDYSPMAHAQTNSEWVCGAYNQSLKRDVQPEPDGLGITYPVVTIHGITGSDQNFEDEINLSYHGYHVKPPRSLMDLFAGAKGGGELPPPLPGAHVYSFSYTPDSLRWVDHDRVGGAFARAVDCLYERHGVPLVVVAHSMGGLVTRWVANSVDKDGNSRAHKIGKVITLGTPYDGSDLAENLSAPASTIARYDSFEVQLAEQLVSWCGRTGTQTGSGSCDLISVLASEAGLNLRGGSPALRQLKRWPEVDTFAIAGEIKVRTYLFRAEALTVELGDVVVAAGSATHDAKMSRTFVCEYDLGNVSERLWKRLTLSYGPEERNREIAGAIFEKPCYHSNLMRNVEVTNEVIGQVADWIGEQRRRANDWIVAPGRLGPLTIGASGAELADAGIVVPTPNSLCDSPYALARDTFDESLGEPAVFTEWRFGTSGDDLDGILIKGQQFRTENGMGVGSTRHDIERAYGDNLKTATMDTFIDSVSRVDVIYGSDGVLVFHLDERDIVMSMQLLPGRPGEVLENMAVGC